MLSPNDLAKGSSVAVSASISSVGLIVSIKHINDSRELDGGLILYSLIESFPKLNISFFRRITEPIYSSGSVEGSKCNFCP
jgi:hypothetical protein